MSACKKTGCPNDAGDFELCDPCAGLRMPAWWPKDSTPSHLEQAMRTPDPRDVRIEELEALLRRWNAAPMAAAYDIEQCAQLHVDTKVALLATGPGVARTVQQVDTGEWARERVATLTAALDVAEGALQVATTPLPKDRQTVLAALAVLRAVKEKT